MKERLYFALLVGIVAGLTVFFKKDWLLSLYIGIVIFVVTLAVSFCITEMLGIKTGKLGKEMRRSVTRTTKAERYHTE